MDNPLSWVREKIYELAAPAKSVITEQIVTVFNDLYRGYIPNSYIIPKDWILAEKGGYNIKIYRRVFEDPQVQACFRQRTKAVTSRQWQVAAGDDHPDSIKAANFISHQIGNLGQPNSTLTKNPTTMTGFGHLCEKMLEAMIFDVSVAEINFGEVEWTDTESKKTEAYIGLPSITIWDSQRFNFSPSLELQLKTMENPYGKPVAFEKFWVLLNSNQVSTDPPLAHYLYFPVLFKSQGLKFWLGFLDQYGNPTKIGKYPPTLAKDQQENIRAALKAVGQNTNIVIPDNVEISLLEATRSGSADYTGFATYWDEQIAKLVVGQTMTTTDSSGKYRGDHGMDILAANAISDADWLSASVNRDITYPLWDWNIANFPQAAMPRFSWKLDAEEDKATRITVDTALFNQGYKLTADAVKRIYGDDYEFSEDEVTLLNAAQLTTMTGVLAQVASGAIPPNSAIEIFVSTLGIPEDSAKAIVEPMAKQLEKAQPEQLPPAQLQPQGDQAQLPEGQDSSNNPEEDKKVPDWEQGLELAKGDGIPCGKSFISADKSCRIDAGETAKAYAGWLKSAVDSGKKLNPKNQAAFDEMKGKDGEEKAKGGSAPKDKEGNASDPPPLNEDPVKHFSQEMEVAGNKLKVYSSDPFFPEVDPPPHIADVTIAVNSGLDKMDFADPKDGIKIALAARKSIRDSIKQLPDGTVLSNTPYGGDGHGERRKDLYQSAGFSNPGAADDFTGNYGAMYAVVKDGKLAPITIDQIKEAKKKQWG